MYSPQRNKVQSFDRFSPNRSPHDYRIQKRVNEELTLEEFLAAKKNKVSSPVGNSVTTRSSPNRSTTLQNRMVVTKSSPVHLSSVRPRANSRIVSNRNRISPQQNRTTTTTTSQRTVPNRRPGINNDNVIPIQNNRTRTTIIPNRRASVYINKSTTEKRTSMYNKTTMPHKSSTGDQKIQVCIRKRPLNKVELANNEQDIAPLVGSRTIEIHAPKQKVDLTRYTEQHSFTFDEVFDNSASNKSIYQKTTRPLVDHMFQGGKATCFAYGQTGSGKTYTMLDSKHGLYVQATSDIFRFLNQAKYAHLQAWVGYYEIYQGQLYDLLNGRRQLIPREDGKGNVHISGLKEHRIHSSDTMMQVFHYGNRERSTCKTNANESSSRSHAILQILLKKGSSHVYGKLNFIDLAGSERGTDRGHHSDAKIRLEGAEINRSLLALKECIRALDQDKRHAPFRGSKLTMVLKDSFVGNSKTCMIATISPNHSNSDHTLNTLRYADRVKELKGESDPRLQTKSKQQKEEEDEDNVPRKITQGHIKEFLHLHQVQLECNQHYMEESQSLLQNISQHIKANNNDSLYQKYKTYKQSLEDLMNRKECSVQKLRDRIGLELDD